MKSKTVLIIVLALAAAVVYAGGGEWYDSCPTPPPTLTAQPTYTPVPTWTPQPTPTCRPTWTPQPTEVLLPTSTPYPPPTSYPMQPSWASSPITVTATPTVTPIDSTYWVAPGGNDANLGTEALPWATIDKAATTASGGDVVTFKDGIYGTGTGEGGWNSGTPGNPITFRAQNSRQATWAQGAAGSNVYLDAKSYITFEGLVLQGNGDAQTGLFFIDNASSYIVIDDCMVGPSKDADYGIFIRHGSHHIMIRDSVIHPDNWGGGTNEDGINVSTSTTHDITVEGCEIYETSHGGINIDDGYNIVIRDSNIYDTGSHCVSLESCENVLVEDCRIHDADTIYGDPGGWHAGLRLTAGVKNATIRNNEIYGNQAYGIYIRYDVTGPVSIYNNTLYDNCLENDEASIRVDENTGTDFVDNITIKNNIVYDTRGKDILRSRSEHEAWLIVDHNLYYTSSVTETISRNNTNYVSYQGYKAAGFEPNTVVSEDPSFNDAAGGDFTLQAGSPAIDAGADVGLPYAGDAPDIGARERGTVATSCNRR